MGNMSYCRFKNTSQDLGDCLDAIENNELNDLADFEYEGMRDLLSYCEAILEHQEKLEEAIDDNR
tara:strand:+ start:166 stop:360 length:195 start_codon:yes stop_codon:yes gene_type:complete